MDWIEAKERAGWHAHRLRVRYGETDQMGVVHHANYLLYMEEGRTRMMASLGCSYAELERSGIGLPVRKASLRFRAPARYDDELVVLTRLERVGGASVAFQYEVRSHADALLAEGSSELACVDLASPERRPRFLPDEVREGFERAIRA
jgi:acyl-CoA thioester hydrolase